MPRAVSLRIDDVDAVSHGRQHSCNRGRTTPAISLLMEVSLKTRVLLTSVCRPLGERHGDAKSVGYELLYGQVTRSQGLFSPRANHVQFSSEYIAENLEAPTTVLHYPSKR